VGVVGKQGGGAKHRRPRHQQQDGAVLKKTTPSPNRRKHGVIPPKANSAFVAAMEDVLAVYTRPRAPSSALYRPNASTAASRTNKLSSTKSLPGSTTAMPTTPRQTGTSPPPTHASNSSIYTLQSD